MTPTFFISDLRDAALDYALRGWRGVPLHSLASNAEGGWTCSCGRAGCKSTAETIARKESTSAGKHPRIKDWAVNASNDSAQVAQWWAKWPDANVGIALGTGTGLVSIDLDSEAGEAVVLNLAGDEGLPDTLEMTTSAGRRRLLFAIPDGLEDEPVTVSVPDPAGGEAVRFQSTGGQCVMPPSLHYSGVRYTWVAGRSPAEIEPAPMPAWLIAKMTPDKPAVVKQPATQSDVPEVVQRFNADADWLNDILIPAGWKLHTTRADGVMEVTRPGKSGGCSATIGHHKARDGTPALHVFTGSVAQLPASHAYDKFGAYARLSHGGDTAAAIRALAGTGRFGRLRGKAERAAESTPVNSVDVVPAAWEDFVPLRNTFKLPKFPIETLPLALVDLICQASDSVGCPTDYAGSHALGVAAGAISGTYDLQIKRGHWQTTNLWVCVVAKPGSGKSPSVAPILAPVYAEQAKRNLAGNQPAFVSNVTCEKLARMLQDHDRGLLMVWDEMSGWLTSFNQYKSNGGNDRAHYLSMWDGRAVKVDRVNKDSPPIFVRYPRLSLVGGIQPDVLQELRSGPSDGLFDRMLFVYPNDRGLAAETFREVDDHSRSAWKDALGNLWKLPITNDDSQRPRPYNLLLDTDGRAVWQAWTNELSVQSEDEDKPAYFRSIASKMQGYAARLALVVYLIHKAYSGGGIPGDVGAESMQHGVTLARYFLAHADRVYRSTGRDEKLVAAEAILRWLVLEKRNDVTRRDLWLAMRKRTSIFEAPEDLEDPLRLLTAHCAIRWKDVPRLGPGRPSSGVLEVNPALFGRELITPNG